MSFFKWFDFCVIRVNFCCCCFYPQKAEINVKIYFEKIHIAKQKNPPDVAYMVQINI